MLRVANLLVVVVALTGLLNVALAEPTTLVRPFALSSSQDWDRQQLGLSSGNWRIGDPSGPIASDALFSRALAALQGLSIASTCSNGDDGGLTYYCGMQVSRIDFATHASDRFLDPLSTNAGWLQRAGSDLAIDAEWSGTGGDEGGYIGVTNTSLDSQPTRLALLAPARYLGDASSAFGGFLTFSVLAFADGPSSSDLGSGIVSLTADVEPIPEPSTAALLMVSLGLVFGYAGLRSRLG